MEVLLTVEGLEKSFKDRKVLHHISFEVRKGEIMAILGPNGAGKSTTIRNIMGIMYPDAGKITFHGYEGRGIPRHKIGYLPEERGLYKNVKVMDILLYLADLKDYPVKKAKERALAYLKKFDLEGKEQMKMEELSKGMAQKVQFISAILHEPELLILDEPFSGLDPVSQELFKEEIRNLAKQGTAILLSSHQMNLVEEICDRLFMIQRGQKVIYGTLDEVKTEYANFKCTIRGNNDASRLERIPDVQRVEQKEDVSVLYLTKSVNPARWLKICRRIWTSGNWRWTGFPCMKSSWMWRRTEGCFWRRKRKNCRKRVKLMLNTMKVARWEIKRNLKNKTFVISLFLTPALMVVFGILGSLSGGGAEDEKQAMKIYVNDGLGVFESLEETADRYHLPLRLFRTDVKEADVGKELAKREKAAFLFADERAFSEGVLPLYTGDDFPDAAISQIQMLTEPVKFLQLQRLGLTEEQLAVVTKPISVQPVRADEGAQSPERNKDGGEAAAMKKAVPGIFAGVILLCIIFSGMMIFQSASQEKKDKIAEILLSSVTPNELMQGKIVGYFVLGLIQVAVFIAFGIPFVLWKTDFPLFRYLFVPELLLFLLIAVLGYLLFAALFVGIGATMSDISTAGNFQGLVIMLPFIPLFFIGPVSADPSGTLAQVLTYVPFTSPVILLLRLVLLDEWRWMEIVLSLAVLAASVWLFMKLAGKIFKIGILLYGKNATPKEIWKWIRA